MGSQTSYDVIIIGAGSIGVPAALALAQRGIKTLVLDVRPSPGQGANKAAIGGVRATHSDPAKIRLCRRSLEVFSSWQEIYGQDLEWQAGGYVFVAYREEEARALKALLTVQQAYGLEIGWLEREALLMVAPDLNPEGLLGGTYAPGDGHLSTLLASHALYEEARRAGAEFRFDACVTGFIQAGGRVTGVTTDRGSYAAGVVINAAGGQARRVAKLARIDVPVTSEAHEAGISEPVAPFLKPMIVDIRPAPGSTNTYFYQTRSGQVIFCLSPEPSLQSEDTRETSTFLPLVAQRLLKIMPRFSPLRVRRTWCGLYPMTPDGLPIVGWAEEASGLLLAVGMCGQGFMLGPGLGELLARLVDDRPAEGDREILERISPARSFGLQERLR